MSSSKVYNQCAKCGKNVRMKKDKPMNCPYCNTLILPCSSCKVEDCNKCPYTKKG